MMKTCSLLLLLLCAVVGGVLGQTIHAEDEDKVVAKDLRGEELAVKLADLFN